jgi:sodium/hydrogen antiporter
MIVGEEREVATDPEKAPAYMAQAVLGFNDQLERILEFGVVVLVGAMLSDRALGLGSLWLPPLLFLVIRPLAVWAGLVGSDVPRLERAFMGWFGIRGLGSIYYLMFGITLGVAPELAERLVGLTLTVVAASIVVHGVTVTPLINLYERRIERERSGPGVRPPPAPARMRRGRPA